MKKILQLSTYPIGKPLHGGQIRVSQIRKFFEDKGHEVKSLSLSEMSHGYYSSDDFLLNNSELQDIVKIPFCSDYATSVLSTKGQAYNFLKKNISSFSPNIILIEQCWLWSAIKKLKSEGVIKESVKIFYSSQNIEYKTKRLLLEHHNVDNREIEYIVEKIYQLEKDISQNSNGVISCTNIDASEFEKLGAKKSIVCNNGVSSRTINNKVSIKLLNDLDGLKYALFVGSAYPPNAIGFWDMMGDSLAWLSPEYVILAVGGVSKILESYQPKEIERYQYINTDRIKKVGFVSDKLLASLIDNASVILLPITIGGGSNLKTAEAIASLKPVVATRTACRGFDFTETLSHFTIAKNKDEFIEATKKFIYSQNRIEISQKEKDIRSSVYWKNTLLNLNLILD